MAPPSSHVASRLTLCATGRSAHEPARDRGGRCATPVARRSAAASARPAVAAAPGPASGSPRRRPAVPGGRARPGRQVDGPEHVGVFGQLGRARAAPSTAAGAPSTAAMCTAGGRPTSARASSSASAWPTGSQRISACTVGIADSATTATTPPSARGAHQRGGGHPAAQRVLGGAQVLAARAAPSRRAAAPRRSRRGARGSAPGCGDDQRGRRADLGDHGVARRR